MARTENVPSPPSATLRGVAITTIIVTSIVFFGRCAMSIRRWKGLGIEDCCLVLAFAFYLAITILYLVVYPPIMRIENVAVTGMYAQINDDALQIKRTFFANTMMLWCCLWSVKFAFMALYYKLVQGFRTYLIMWWVLIGFIIATLIGCVVTEFLMCFPFTDGFTLGKCSGERAQLWSGINLFYSYTADVLTDILIMVLPLRLLSRKLQRSFREKMAVGALLSVGVVNIVIATVRETSKSARLALFGIIEGSITVMVGCAPGLYVAGKDYQKSRVGTARSGYASNYPRGNIYVSKGYDVSGYTKQGSAYDVSTNDSNVGNRPGRKDEIEMKVTPIRRTSSEQDLIDAQRIHAVTTPGTERRHIAHAHRSGIES